MSDAYRELVKSLRDAATQPADGGEATRQRILGAVAALRPAARRTRTLLLLAAAMFASTAFALYIASSAHERDVVPVPKSPAAAPNAVPAASTPSTPSHEAERAPVAPFSATPAESSLVRPAQRAAKRRGASAGVRTASGAEEAAPDVRSDAGARVASPEQRKLLYAEAHRQHFRATPHSALAAWDAFLATSPSGPLLVEAQYNRAVTLLRLGRRADAEQALAPFARGDHAGFRQIEAKQLLLQLAR